MKTHHEVQIMQEAGMSNYDILKSGTVNVAAYFNMEGEYGTITEYASADFILEEGNSPLVLKNLKKYRRYNVECTLDYKNQSPTKAGPYRTKKTKAIKSWNAF